MREGWTNRLGTLYVGTGASVLIGGAGGSVFAHTLQQERLPFSSDHAPCTHEVTPFIPCTPLAHHNDPH